MPKERLQNWRQSKRDKDSQPLKRRDFRLRQSLLEKLLRQPNKPS